jgi:hypothetical protein
MTLALLLLSAFFILALIARSALPNLCAICASVSLTWLALIVLYFRGEDVSAILISVLMGGSAVGLLYYLSAKIPEKWNIFKFPFLLTLFAGIYLIFEKPDNYLFLLIIVGLWLATLGILLASKGKVEGLSKRIIECCKNW